MIAKIFGELTDALSDLADNGPSFDGGPLGEVKGLLDKFGLDFDDLVAKFMDSYDTFKSDLESRSLSLPDFDLRPISLPRFPSLLQTGSKIPSIMPSPQLIGILWDKLNVTFPYPTFKGIKIPNLPPGLSFADAFPRDDFPGKIAWCDCVTSK